MKKIIKLIGFTFIFVLIFSTISSFSFAATTEAFTVLGGTLTKYTGNSSNIVIPDGITAIGDNVFYGMTNINSIVIPDSVASIGKNAFLACNNLTSVAIPDSVITIGANAFSNCTSMTSIKLPNNIKTIDDGTFSSCRSLVSVTIPEGVTSIGKFVFSGCMNLENLVFPDSVTTIGHGTFVMTKLSAPIIVNHGKTLSFVPGNLTSYDIPSGITTLGADAFWSCRKLKSVTMPDSVTIIDIFAFAGCSELISVKLSDNLNTIGYYAFTACPNLTSITLPDTVTSVGTCAFSGSGITYPIIVNQGKTLSYVPVSLTNYNIPNGITAIGGGAFNECVNLTSVTIPDSVKTIGEMAFSYCTSLSTLVIPEGVTSISNHAFTQCSSLVSVIIPDSVTEIGAYAFNGTQISTSIIINGGKTLSYVPSSFTSYNIPNGVETIGDSVFTGGQLAQVSIPASVRYIGNDAFDGCMNLTSVTLPEGVTDLGTQAFSNCWSLTDLIIPATVTTIGNGAFYGDGEQVTLYGTEGSATEQYAQTNKILFVESSALSMFADLDGYRWAKGSILYLANASRGIVSGYGDGTFGPEKNITRAEFAKLMVGMMGYNGETADSNFEDVRANTWYYPAVSIAFKHGIIKGTSDITFDPDAYITREDMAVIMARTLGLDGANNTTYFIDNSAISDYAKASVDICSHERLIRGNPGGTFLPKENASRAEATVIIRRMLFYDPNWAEGPVLLD